MTNIVQRAIAAGQRRLQRMAEVSITYVRADGGAEIPISARKAIVRDELVGNMDRPVRVDRWRFTFEADDLVDGGQVVQPEEGDEIRHVVGTQQVVYRATPVDSEKPCWGWNDSGQRELYVDTVTYGEE
jgi:hypothetical protein